MSRETIQWLNTNVLVGFTDKRGKAWHSRKGYDNHYPGAIPVDDVRGRLFDWKAEEKTIFIEGRISGTGHVRVPGKKAIVRSDTAEVLGIFADAYQPHDYNQWLIKNVESILDDDLQIGTAGLLRGGGQAWVQVEVPDTVTGPAGITFRPFLLAATSLDGTLATTYGRAVTNTVCDNTMAIAMGEHNNQRYRVRHSSKSLGKLKDARDALGIIYSATDDFSRQVEKLLGMPVSAGQFNKILNLEVPFPDRKKAPSAWTVCDEKRTFLWDLYRFDERVAPWTGTAFGAWQAFNTYRQHERKIRTGSHRVERNASWLVTGENDKIDAKVLETVMGVAA